MQGSGSLRLVTQRRVPLPLFVVGAILCLAAPPLLVDLSYADPLSAPLPSVDAPLPPPSPPYLECPAVGANSSCSLLIWITDQGTFVLGDTNQLFPYDGADDTLVGVRNDSHTTYTSLPISSEGAAIFAFDNDGLCTYLGTPPYCGVTGYEGPGVTFADIDVDKHSGVLQFAPPLTPGSRTFFALEAALTTTPPNNIDVPPPIGSPFCIAQSDDGWVFAAEVSAHEGLVLKDLRFGPRLVARRMSVPYVVVQEETLTDFQYGRLTPSPLAHLPTSDGVSLSSTLIKARCRSTGADVGVGATYRVTAPDGTRVLVDQDYRFDHFDPADRCESTESVPCVRFWPTITWALDTAPPSQATVLFKSVQRLEFDPDASGKGSANLTADDLSLFGHIEELGNGRLREEDSREVIVFGERGDWDNWHQSGRAHVDLPGINPLVHTPGCSDCVHAHWLWGKDANCGCTAIPFPFCRDHECWTDGKPELLDGSRQDVEAGWVVFKANEIDPWPRLWFELVDKFVTHNRTDSSLSTNDRLVLYWDADSRSQFNPSDGVTIRGKRYQVGDSFWPQLPDKIHGGNGSMFFVPARLLGTDPPSRGVGWKIEPRWDSIAFQPGRLDERLPAGYVLPVVISAPRDLFADKWLGPFYLRVNSVSSHLLNADEVFTKYVTRDDPWIVLHHDSYTPGKKGKSARFDRGEVVKEISAWRSLVTYLVFREKPTDGSLGLTLVATPDGRNGYIPAID